LIDFGVFHLSVTFKIAIQIQSLLLFIIILLFHVLVAYPFLCSMITLRNGLRALLISDREEPLDEQQYEALLISDREKPSGKQQCDASNDRHGSKQSAELANDQMQVNFVHFLVNVTSLNDDQNWS